MENVFIFGAAEKGETTFRFLNREKYRVIGFLDNDPDKIGTFHMGRCVYPVEHLFSFEKNIKTIIASDAHGVIGIQLKRMGYGNSIEAGLFLMKEEGYESKCPLFVANILNSDRTNSQWYEDLIVEAVFNSLGVNLPKYIDIGANMPESLNNTYLFYKKGSVGQIIEPNPYFSELYRKVRPNDEFLEIALSNTRGEADFCIFDEASGLSTLILDNVERVSKYFGIKPTHSIVRVKIDTFNNVVHKDVQYMSLDTEGKDLDILKNIDFDLFPELVVICSETPKPTAINYLNGKGFIMFYRNSANVVFVRNDIVPKVFEDKLCSEIYFWGKLTRFILDKKHPDACD